MIQSNSKIFTTTLFGVGSDESSMALIEKNLDTIETYLGSAGISNLGTKQPRLPSNQRIAKD
jgi:hypothetical protein